MNTNCIQQEEPEDNESRVISASQRLHEQFNFTRVPNEIIEHPDLSVQAKMIWIELWKFCYRGNGEGIFPGMAKLAQDLNLSEETIRKHRRSLEAKGLVKVHQRGLTKSNVYYLFAPKKPLKHVEPKKTSVQEPNTGWVQAPAKTCDEEDEVLIRQTNKTNAATENFREKENVPSDNNSLDAAIAANSIKKTKTQKRPSLKDYSREDLVDLCEANPAEPPAGISRPQMLVAALDKISGFSDIVEKHGWKSIMMRFGQLFNPKRKITLEYRDLMAAAFSYKTIPKPNGRPANIDYLITVLSRQAQERMADRYESEQEARKLSDDDLVEVNRLIATMAKEVRM